MRHLRESREAEFILDRLRRTGASFSVLLILWGAYSLLRIALLPFLSGSMGDPDNYMRLLEVRDLLAGQSWFDVHQYRMNPPLGADMHWSRLVDMPLALLAGGLSLVLPAHVAELAATVIVPLLYLLATMAALRVIMLRLGLLPVAVFAGLATVPLFPMLLQTFGPYSIDHHGPQATLALGCAATLLYAPARKAALLGGVLAAAWIVVSLEGLALVASLAGILGLRYLLLRDRSLAWFLGALALAAPALSFATRPMAEFTAFRCDIMLEGHMAAFAIAALAFPVLSVKPLQGRLVWRLTALTLAGGASATAAYVLLGRCAANPFAELDPLIRTYWYDFVLEGLPFWRQLISVQIMLVWTLLLIPAGLWAALHTGLVPRARRAAWLPYTAFALAAVVCSLLLMRAAIVAQLLAIPFAAALIVRFLPKARAITAAVPRALATVACLTLATPALPSALGKPLDPLFVGNGIWAEALALRRTPECDLTRLRALPHGLIFATLDLGPEIVTLTPHAVVMSGYHRNQAAMKEVIDSFSGDLARAEKTVKASGATYVVVCSSKMDTALYRTRRPDNLANRLVEGRAPDWLVPVKLGKQPSGLLAYRIVR